MTIMTKKVSDAPEVIPTKQKIESPKANSVIVDNQYTSTDALATHVSGSAYIVDYYRQVINKDNALYSQDIGQIATQQQYILYKQLELRQQGSLSVDQDDKDKVFNVRGTAFIHSSIIPNEGDMFAGDIGDGRLGIFNVTRSQRMSIMKDTVYQIEYALTYTDKAQPLQLKDLNSKVIDTFYYVKERMDFNDNPFLAEAEYNFFRYLGSIYENMRAEYFNDFFSKEVAAFILPDQTQTIFDYFIYKALRVLYRDDKFSFVQKHQAINIDDDDVINREKDLFTVLLKRSKHLFDICEARVGYARLASFHWEGSTNPITYTGITSIVYPVIHEDRIDLGLNRNTRLAVEEPFRASTSQLPDRIKNKEVTGFLVDGKTIDLIKPVSIDTYYVFSQAFYEEDTENLSILEAMTLAYINNKSFNYQALKLMCENYKYWNRLERFYYKPVLMILIQSILKDL